MKQAVMGPLAAMVGIDWADDHHDVALQVSEGAPIEEGQLRQTPEAVQAWLATLAQRFPGQQVGIAMETSRGPLVHALLEASFVVLYPVNPRSLSKFRETFTPSGAKDDAPDARLLLSLLVKHRDQLRPWTPNDDETRKLQRLVELRRRAVGARTGFLQELQSLLKEYYPQALTWAGTDLTSPLACDFLERWPTLNAVQRARPTTLRHFYTTHNCRNTARIDERLAEMRTATPLTTDPAIIDSSVPYVLFLVGQLRESAPRLAHFDTLIADVFAAHPDADIFASLPGAGAAFAPRLLVAFGTDRTRFPTAEEVQQCSGIAPVTVRSGRGCYVRWRWAVSAFLRQTFHEFAHHSVRQSAWARAYYAQLRARGKTHHAALRALAFKWIRIIWRCWQDHTPYDDARYTRALVQRGSPVAAQLAVTHP